MAIYSYAQLESLWINAGGPKALAPIAAAIGEAESGGNSDALNPNDNNGTQSSFGIWQISNGTHTPPDPNWANPAVNARLAVAKWKAAGGFSPWGTYTSGAYRAFLSGKTTPDPNVPGSATALAAQAAASGQADCLMQNPLSVSLPLVGSITGGPVCLITKSNARGWIGAALMVAGALTAGSGLLVVAIGAAVAVANPVLSAVESVPVAGSYVRGARGAASASATAAGRAAVTSRGP